MIYLNRSLSVWGTPEFESTLKAELERLDASELPLQEGLSQGSYSMGDNLGVMVLGVSEDKDVIRVRIGVFYASIIAGCNCADDPTPVDEQNEYCELVIQISKENAGAIISIDN